MPQSLAEQIAQIRLKLAREQAAPHTEPFFDPEPQQPTQAAVLIPLIASEHGLNVLLTRRAEHLRHHPGQISFPGGRVETRDANAVQTALRESHEEIGLPSDCVEVLGALPSLVTVSGFQIQPIVGVIKTPFVMQLDASEVAEAFEVPLSFLMNRAHYQSHRIERGAQRRHVWAVAHDGRFIWGVTAQLLYVMSGLE